MEIDYCGKTKQEKNYNSVLQIVQVWFDQSKWATKRQYGRNLEINSRYLSKLGQKAKQRTFLLEWIKDRWKEV